MFFLRNITISSKKHLQIILEVFSSHIWQNIHSTVMWLAISYGQKWDIRKVGSPSKVIKLGVPIASRAHTIFPFLKILQTLTFYMHTK